MKKVENEHVIIKIEHDPDAESPRTWGNLGTIVSWHTRYTLGDKNIRKDDYNSEEDVLRGECGNPKDILYLPVYILDHSGISLSTSSFNDRWDSGQCGWIYATREDIRKFFDVKRITKDIEKRAFDRFKVEVEILGQYIEGDIFGYVIEKKIKCEGCDDVETEEIDSCWGFFGDNPFENGMIDHIDEEYHELLKELA